MRYSSKKYPKGIRVAGLILSGDKHKIILIERYKEGKHYFVFPGGGIETIDTNKREALIREIREETNTEVRIINRLYELRIKGHSKQFFYLCEYLSGELSITGEEKEKQKDENLYRVNWFPIDKLFHMKVYPLEVRDWLLKDLQSCYWQKRIKEFTSFDSKRN